MINNKDILHPIFSRLAGGQNLALITPSNYSNFDLTQLSKADLYNTWLPNNTQWLFVHISQNLFSLNNTAADFWYTVWSGFTNQSVGEAWQVILEKLALTSITQPISSNRLLRQLNRQEVRLVLLIDRLDKLAENRNLFTSELLGPLRSWSSRHLCFSIVFSSNQRLSKLNKIISMAGSPPFNNFIEIQLTDFVIA